MSLGICLNHRISRFSPFLRVAGDEHAAAELAEAFARHCPEIGMCRLYDAKEVSEVSTDLVIVLWPDYPPIPGRLQRKIMWLQNGGWEARIPEFQARFDLVCCASQLLCQRHPGLVYLPIACSNRTLFRPVPPDPRLAAEVCFLGNYSLGRVGEPAARYLLPATEFRFAIWGSGWEAAEPVLLRRFARGRLPVRLGPAVHSSCQIFLSFHDLRHRADDMPSGRVFDAIGCEAFVISDYMPSLEPLRRHLVFTTGGEELREQLRYFLAHPEERRATVAGGHAFIQHHYTNEQRAAQIARILGLTWR